MSILPFLLIQTMIYGVALSLGLVGIKLLHRQEFPSYLWPSVAAPFLLWAALALCLGRVPRA